MATTLWYSLHASIQNIDGVTNTNVNYYFRVDISSSLVTGFYSYNNIGVNLLVPVPPSLPFFTQVGQATFPPYYSQADNLFNTTTLLFSAFNGINFSDTYLQNQPIQYLISTQNAHFHLNYPLFSFYGYDSGSGYKNYLWAYAGPDPPNFNDILTNSVDIQLLSGQPVPLTPQTVLNNGSIWVAGGSSIATSIDGKTWTTVPSSPTNVNSLAFTGSEWIACCDGSNNIYSGTSDAKSWYLSTTLSSFNLFKVAFANNTLFALSSGKIFYSTDLNLGAWSSYTAAVGNITGFAYNGSQFLFSSATSLISTPNLTTWSVTTALPSVSKALSINNSLQGAATVKPIVVACTDSSFNTLGYTYDGIQWYGCGNTALQIRANHAAWNGSLWVAVGKSASSWFSWSRDGINWVYQPDTLFDEAFSLAWNGSLWVAAGEGAAFSLATSSDGVTWAGVSESKSIFVDRAIDVKWTGVKWVACGSPSIVANSFDANTWTLTDNVLVGDLSSVLLSFTTSATSNSGAAQYAFDLSSATSWTSQTGAYDASTGLYTGTAEYVRIDFSSNVVVNQYFLQSSAIDWALEGSTDGTTWITLHAAIDSTTSSFFSFANTTPYMHYRVVFYRIAANSGVTYVQATNVDFFGRQALSKFYRMNNTKRGLSYFVNTGYSTWLQQYDGSAVLTPVKRGSSFSYDGLYGVITDLSTNGVYYTTQIDVSLSSVALPNASYTSCFNGTHFFVGGANSQIAYAHPSDMTSWYTVLTPFTGGNILALVSNSGIGFVSPPNSLYLDPGEKLSLVAPKFYDINLVGRGPTFNFGLSR